MSNPFKTAYQRLGNEYNGIWNSTIGDDTNPYLRGVSRRINDMETVRNVFDVPARTVNGVLLPAVSQGQRIKAVHEKQRSFTPDALFDIVEGKSALTPRNTVSMRRAQVARKVFNDGAEARPYAITSDKLVDSRGRSKIGEFARNAVITALYADTEVELSKIGEQEGVPWSTPTRYTMSEVKQACEDRIYVSQCGPSAALGRVKLALRSAADLNNPRPPTTQEVEEAMDFCGLFLSSKKMNFHFGQNAFIGCEMEWPLSGTGEGNSVQVARGSDLGHPYYSNGINPDALAAALSDMKFLESDSAVNDDAKAAYKQMMVTSVDRVLCVAKAKPDMYGMTKIDKCQLRLYNVIPGGLKFYLQKAAQPYANARVTLPWLQEKLFEKDASPGWNMGLLRTAQKTGLTGQGPSLMIASLDVQLAERGCAFLHCGDDMIFVIRIVDNGRLKIMVLSVDCSNFDLTQEQEVIAPIIEKIERGMRHISKPKSKMWGAVAMERVVLLNGTCVVHVRGLGTSGNVLQSEINDALADVLGQRIARELDKAMVVREFPTEEYDENDEPIVLKLKVMPKGLDWIERTVCSQGSSLGLTTRIDNVRTERACYYDAAEGMLRRTVETHGLSFKFLGSTIGTMCGRLKSYGHVVLRAAEGWQGRYDVMLEEEYKGFIGVTPDMGRFASSLAYPKGRFLKDRDAFEASEANRIYSMMLGAGVTFALSDFERARKFICGALIQSISHLPDSFPLEPLELDAYLEGVEAGAADVGALRERIARLSDSPDWLIQGGHWDPFRPQHVPVVHPHAALNLEGFGDEPFGTTNWADMDDEEGEAAMRELLAGAAALGTVPTLEAIAFASKVKQELPNLAALSYRATTRKNFGRPPPNVAVRSDPRPKAEQPSVVVSSRTTSQRRNAQKKRAKARKRGEGYDEEETHRNLKELRELEELAEY